MNWPEQSKLLYKRNNEYNIKMLALTIMKKKILINNKNKSILINL